MTRVLKQKQYFPKLKKGDWVKMYFPFCEMDLWVQFLTYENDMEDRKENPGFVYFHPQTGCTAAWYISNIKAVQRRKKVIYEI